MWIVKTTRGNRSSTTTFHAWMNLNAVFLAITTLATRLALGCGQLLRAPPGLAVYLQHVARSVANWLTANCKYTVMSSTVTRSIFKNTADFDRYSCWKCRHLLQDPVQLACGHRLCQPCADKLVASSGTESLGEIVLKCSAEDCNEDIVDEDGAYVNGR